MFPFFRSAAKSIDVNEIDSLLGKINLVDIREPEEQHDTGGDWKDKLALLVSCTLSSLHLK